MTSPTPDPSTAAAPRWPHCDHRTILGDPIGCRGIHVPGHTACLAHLEETDLAAYLDGLAPGTDVDHRGTTFTEHLLARLLQALQDPGTHQPHFGNAVFSGASFSGDAAVFDGASFSGDAVFSRASFSGDAVFSRASFSVRAVFGGASFSGDAVFSRASFPGDAVFDGASFSGDAVFDGASFGFAVFGDVSFSGDAVFDGASFGVAVFGHAAFSGVAVFGHATFSGVAEFGHATFSRDAEFGHATFSGDTRFGHASFDGVAEFDGAAFSEVAVFGDVSFAGDTRFGGVSFAGRAGFERTRFEVAQQFGPLVCAGDLDLKGAVFGAPMTLEAAADRVSLRRVRWVSTAALRLRYAAVDLAGAVLEYPLTLSADPAPYIGPGPGPLEEALAGRDKGVRVVSVSGVDCAHLTLTDVDLSGCRFAGAVHLDQLRIDGRARFGRPPAGWRRRRLLPARWSQRRTLAEEHHWRAAAAGSRASGELVDAGGWRPGPHHPDLELTPGPETVSAIYRQLRKALEDGKNEPDAADFYYGEMEMRRHDATRPRAERWLLAAYWAASGYGLRASRAMAWLGVAMAVTVLALMLWGLPHDDPKPTTTGRQVEAGQYLETTETPDPVNPTGPLTERVTTDRFEKALRVVINSTVFRSSGQDLTTTGTYTEMTSRFTEPVLLALAILAIRARVKR